MSKSRLIAKAYYVTPSPSKIASQRDAIGHGYDRLGHGDIGREAKEYFRTQDDAILCVLGYMSTVQS